LNVLRPVVSFLALGMLGVSCWGQDLPVSQRIFSLSPALVEMAAKVSPTPVSGSAGTVLVVFRTSEQGGVIDMRSTGGSLEMQRSSEAAISQWKFRPMFNGNGQPMELFSAVTVNFSGERPVISTPMPMTAAQLSPMLGYRCSNAIAHQTPDAVPACKKQLEAIVKKGTSTKMEQFTAYDEYGVALLNASQKSDVAFQQFSRAIEIAAGCLKPSDAEWAYALWHRGVASSRIGDQVEAKKDLAAAIDSLKLAEAAIGFPGSTYYHQLEERISQQ
jgi:hypothetical protein